MAESDNILTKLHDLLSYLVPQLKEFRRDRSFVLGDRIESNHYWHSSPEPGYRSLSLAGLCPILEPPAPV